MNRSGPMQRLRPWIRSHPGLKRVLKSGHARLGRMHHALADRYPALIRPRPKQLTVAVTASCNLRCQGCLYGREFMHGARLSWPVMREVLDDAAGAGIQRIRLYGGEPLLHPDILKMVEHSTRLGMDTYLTTNGVLLGKRIEELYAAGMRWSTIGFYGVGDTYDQYTQREGHYEKLEQSLGLVREHCGDSFELQLNFVLIRPTCNLEALAEAWAFAERFDMFFHLDLYGYSMPFFTDGPGDSLAFKPEDRPQCEEVTAEILRLRAAHPERFPQSEALIRSVPDWLLRGADMRVPCDAYELLWLGADGSLQLCDVTFPLGNVNEKRMRELLFSETHKAACRAGFQLDCPNCTCKSDSRILKHGDSYARYV